MSKCQLKSEPFHQCCCQCRDHLPTYEHCFTNPSFRQAKGSCICSIQSGWACVTHGRISTNWPEHSVGCECFISRETKA